MKKKYKIVMKEILEITNKIQKNFPELYKLLGETPLFLNRQNSDITLKDYKQYAESLKTQLLEFEKK